MPRLSTSLAATLLLLAGCRVSPPASAPASPQPVPPPPELNLEAIQLQHASATEVAATINELLEASRLAAQAGPRCALYPPDYVPELADPIERIVADPRTNALLVRLPRS